MKLYAISKLSWVVFLSLGLTIFLSAQIGRGRINGVVKDEKGNPLKGAKVVGNNQQYGIIFEVYTDKNGKWTKSGLRGGGWRITASADGYLPDTVNINLSQFSRYPPIEFRLKKIKIKTDIPFIEEESSMILFKEGNRLYEEGKYDEAIASFEQFLEKNPAIYQVHINIGNCYRDKGEYDKAIEEYNLIIEAVKKKKESLEGDLSAAKALANIGECHLKKGDMETAHKFFKDAVDIYPEDENLAYNVGEIYFKNTQIEEAIKYFELASKINPQWSEPCLKLGYAYLNKADYEKALLNFDKFLELDPESPQAQTVRDMIATIEKIKK